MQWNRLLRKDRFYRDSFLFDSQIAGILAAIPDGMNNYCSIGNFVINNVVPGNQNSNIFHFCANANIRVFLKYPDVLVDLFVKPGRIGFAFVSFSIIF